MISIRHLFIVFGASACSTNVTANSASCDPPSGWEKIYERGIGKIVWFGELHGTVEGPEAVRGYICAVTAHPSTKRTLVALEMFAADDPSLTQGLQSESPIKVWTSSMRWRLLAKDGLHSSAMTELLLALDDAIDAGLPIEIVGIGPTLKQQGPKSGSLAQNLAAAIDDRFDQVVVLTGSVHASKSVDQSFRPAASFFPPHDVTSIVEIHDGGSAWHCRGTSCQLYDDIPPSVSVGGIDLRHEVGIDDEFLPAYDGYLYIGRISASPPASGTN